MNTIDLHIHSTHSDGSYTPRELVKRAKKKGLHAISIADHDTITQIKESLEAGEKYRLEVIAGVEVSADFTGGTMHILGYFVDPDDDGLFDMVSQFRAGRDERNPKIIEKLNALGADIAYEDVLREAGGLSVGRPHIARVLVKKGFVKSMEEAFRKYLAKGAPAYVNRVRFSSAKIISVIKQAGGLAFLAHPKQLRIGEIQQLQTLVEELIAEGLDGIEVYSSCHSKEETEAYKHIAHTYNLLISGGSDYHGASKPEVGLGYIGEGIELDRSLVDEMKKRLMSRESRS